MSTSTTDTGREVPPKHYYRKFLLCSFSGAVGDSMSLHLQLLLLSVIFIRSMFDGAEPGVRNTLLPDIVGQSDLTGAVGYYTCILNLARITAPVIAGWVLFHHGNVLIFWIDIFLQLPALIILFKLPAKKYGQHTAAAKENVLSGFRRSVRFIRNTPLLPGLASQIWIVYAAVFLLGLFSQLFRNTNHIIFQLYTPQELRGKVMSIVLSDRGFIAIGMLLATWIASVYSVSLSFVVLGSAALAGPLMFYFIKYKKAVCMLPDKNV